MTAFRPSRRAVLFGAAAAGLTSVATSPRALASPAAGAVAYDRPTMLRWARDTWRSMVALTDEKTGLTADNVPESMAAGDRSRYTSPTNIGAYLWSCVAARDLGLITPGECVRRTHQTLRTLLRMSVHPASGMYVNWYDPVSGDVITVWPDDGTIRVPFYSSVDNGWLGAGLQVVRNAVPGAAPFANRLWDRMRWDMFYDNNPADPGNRPGGLIHGGFYDTNPGSTNTAVFTGNHIGVGPDVWYTNHHYDTTVSETRITTYLGLIRGQIPATNYYALWRTFPASCDWDWQEMQPVGVTRTYFGLDVYEGAYTYRGMRIVPGWGGSMFEELMPNVFVPEETWAPRSWGVNHPLFVRGQREHGLLDAKYGYWGFSPSSDPATPPNGYGVYGVDLLGLNPDGYGSDEEQTNVDIGFGTCRAATNPNPAFGDGVVTPHASFLAMMHERDTAFANLSRIEQNLHAYGSGGFFDAVATKSGRVARRYLALDQGMIMGVFGNLLAGSDMRRAFSTAAAEKAIRPVIGVEQFGAGG